MNIGLVLTNDWEVFGDGSGDYFNLQYKPLRSLLEVFKEHTAKLTVMAEVGQQWAHQRIAAQEPWAHDIVVSWESMLQDTIRQGHDVQLHFHPQWLQAKYADNRWHVNLEEWAIGALPAARLDEVLREAKRYLEGLLQPVRRDYACIAFRAGAYCIEPSTQVIQQLLRAGMVCDTSVVKGLYNPMFYDYRDACSHVLPWLTSEVDVKYSKRGTGGLLEMPLCSYETYDSPLLRKYIAPQLFYRLFFGTRISKEDRRWLQGKSQSMLQKYPLTKRPLFLAKLTSFRWLLSNILAKSAIQLDYDFLPPKVFVQILQKILEKYDRHNFGNITIPVVASGHTKDMHSTENIVRIFQEIQASLSCRVVYWTLSEAIHSWTTFLQEHSSRFDYADY